MSQQAQPDLLGVNNIRLIVKYVLIAAAIVGIILLVRYFINKAKQAKINKALDTETKVTIGGNTQSLNLGTIAAAINDAFHHYYGGMAEDEDRAIAEILNVPKPAIPELSKVYYAISGYNLKDDFVKYLNDDEFAKVRYLFS